MAAKDPFDFQAAAAEDTNPGLDLDMFAPKAKPFDRDAARAASAVAQDAGFSRRGGRTRDSEEPPPPVARKSARGRIAISQAIGGFEDTYPDSQRAQLNMLAPLPVVMRWRELVKGSDAPAWAILEKAMDALAAQLAEQRRGPG
ncbi:MAG: hypothetical protein ACYDD1_13415 [Caulobacteraceae bacterium]